MNPERSYLPGNELANVLVHAYAPCRHFTGPCAGVARWDPSRGYAPRGFIGAFGSLDDIELVLVVAEPGDPHPGVSYATSVTAQQTLEEICRDVYRYFENGTDAYHRNIRSILDRCWPNTDLYEQLTRTWITESFLCSAPVESGTVAARAWKTCVADYLRPQLALLPGRVVVALGSKAQQRLRGVPGVFPAGAAAPPGANFRATRESWQMIPKLLAERRR